MKLLIFLIVWGFVLLISGIVGVFAWPYAINTWLMWAGKAATCTPWNGFFLGLVPVIGQWGIIAAALTFIATFFI